jgi:hypothetical protein
VKKRFLLTLLAVMAGILGRSAWLGRARPALLAGATPQRRDVSLPSSTARVWITDGSLPVFSDTIKLEASHPVLAGLPTRYEGFVDPAVGRGSLEVSRERPGDALFVEAEWYLEFPDGLPREATAETEVVLQGFIEGKWMNRLLDTLAWQPASVGNNVIAAGAGIQTTLGALEGDLAGEARIEYESERGGRRTHVTRPADLRDHEILALVRAVLTLGKELDGIDLGALGVESAVVNEKERVLTAALPFPSPHRAKERLVWRALADGLAILPGTAATMTVTDAAGAVVGEASLLLAS